MCITKTVAYEAHDTGHVLHMPRQKYAAEDEVVRRWWALPIDASLPLDSGACYRLLFAGVPGSASGPDVHDVVFAIDESPTPHHAGAMNCVPTLLDDFGNVHHCKPTVGRLVGDVEFHVRASDWFAHQHHTDARYNRVVLHVVLLCDDERPIRRRDGSLIPTCSLNDLPPFFHPFDELNRSNQSIQWSHWPCQDIMRRMSAEERWRLLRTAGLLRFEQKTDAFVERLREADGQGQSAEQPYDTCLIPAFAEGLAYGRDRAFFHAAGLYLLGQNNANSTNPVNVPEPLGRAGQPSPLDATRLHVLRRLVERWQDTGIWTELRKILAQSSASALEALRAHFVEAGLSRARADILLCNVVLPFAAAVALIEGESTLASQAKQLYLEHPGLPSNRVTRAMCVQLQLEAEPRGSCAQQGLHAIYQSTCREKHCAACLVGKWDL